MSRPPRPPRRHETAPPRGETPAPVRRPPSADDAPSGFEKTLRVAGLPAVDALFRRHPERVLRLFYEDRLVPRVGGFCQYLAGVRRPYRLVDGEELARVAGTVLHGGVVAVTEAPPLPAFDWGEARTWAAATQPLVILDGVGNPHNLGAIARTLAFLGYRHLLLSDHPAQAGLSDAAYRVAEGGLEFLEVRRAARLPELLQRLAPLYRVLGTSLGRGMAPEALPHDPRPMALVLGNEEEGLSPATLRACETIVTLQCSGTVQSMNVAATTAILAYALRSPPPRRPDPAGRDGRGRRAPPTRPLKPGGRGAE